MSEVLTALRDSVRVKCFRVFCKAQKDAGECHIKIPVITFDSPEEEKQEVEEGEEAAASEEDPNPKQQLTTSQSEEFHLCRETTSSESTTQECPGPEQEHLGLKTNDSTISPQLTNDNSSSGIDVHSHPDDTDPLDPNVDSQGFLRIPPALGRYGPGGRTHIRGLSMDSGKDAVLLSDRSHNRVCWQFSSVSIPVAYIYCSYLHPSVHLYLQTFVSLSDHHDHFQVRSGSEGGPDSQRIQLLGVCFLVGVSQHQSWRDQHTARGAVRTQTGSGSCRGR